MSDVINYEPSPTGLSFHQDTDSFVRLILGPVGGGKTTMCCLEMFFAALRQEPDENGVRKMRWLVIRQSYPELKSTVIQTFEAWFGDMCRTVYDVPIRSNIKRPLPDGTTLDLQVWFIAMEDASSMKKLRSLEVTGAYISEASELSESVLMMLRTRVGRYPKKNEATGYGPTWRGIIMESNPPPVKSWMYRLFETDRPERHRLYKQPPALLYDAEESEAAGKDIYHPNPDAENVKYLDGGYDYYYRQIDGATREFVNVYVLGQYGTSFDGKPVFPQFSPHLHVARDPLEVVRSSPVIAGMDFGLQPAVVFTQMTPSGEVHVVDELAPQDVILDEMLEEHILPKVQAKFFGMSLMVIGDPAGLSRSAQSKLSSFETLRTYGIAARPAPTNDIQPRVEAVAHFLKRTSGLLINPSCEDLITAMSGGYRYAKRRSTSFESEYHDRPEKNKHSHIVDALQYAMLYHRFGNGSAGAKRKAPPRKGFLYA